jgi:hypothetical protein
VPSRKGVMVNRTCNRLRQSKANLPTWTRTGVGRGVTSGSVAQAYCAKQTQFAAGGQGRPSPRPGALTMPPAGTNVRNKANSSIADCGFREACGPPPGPARAGCTNKPNWPGRLGPGRGTCAKRSQFGPGVRVPARPNMRNKPNLHPRRGVGGASPTLQVGAMAPNKPNLRQMGRKDHRQGRRP